MKTETSKATLEEVTSQPVKELSKEERASLRESSSKGILSVIEKTLTGIKSLLQSVQMAEQEIAKAAMLALKHAHDHGDVMPMHRLVIGLREFNHPVSTRLSQEVISWVVANSPIRWDAKGKVSQLREGEPGYKPYNEEQAEETPFYGTATALRARQAADQAHARELKPADASMFRARVYGIGKWLDNILEGKDERGVKEGQKTRLLRARKAIEAAVVDVLGEEEKKAA